MSEIDREFWSWFAGFWEGEGSLTKNGRVSICQKDKTPLEFIQSKLGGSLNLRQRKSNFPPHNPIWVWYVSLRRDVIKVAESMFPYLKFRQKKVLEVLEDLREKESKRPSQPRHFKMKPRAWAGEEDEFIRQHYTDMLDREMAENLQRTVESVRARRYELRILRGLKEGIRLREIKYPEYVSKRVSKLQMARRLKYPNFKWRLSDE